MCFLVWCRISVELKLVSPAYVNYDWIIWQNWQNISLVIRVVAKRGQIREKRPFGCLVRTGVLHIFGRQATLLNPLHSETECSALSVVYSVYTVYSAVYSVVYSVIYFRKCTFSVVYSSIQIEIFYKPVWILQYTELVKKNNNYEATLYNYTILPLDVALTCYILKIFS